LVYGASYAGLFQIITFAGAVSVMFMVILMLIGGESVPSGPSFSRERLVGYGFAAAAFIVVAFLLWQFGPSASRIDEVEISRGLGLAANDPLTFLWSLRSWDLLFLTIVISATLAGIVNLFSREADRE
jgi:NADH:ubiquinone oxidoreductase subunit 6 (subunit J)